MIIGLKVLSRFLSIVVLTISLSHCAIGPMKDPRPAPFPADRTTVVGRRPAGFTESYRWLDGLSVEVVEVDHGKLLPSISVNDASARPGDPCSELTVVVRNGADHPMRVTLTARLRYGTDLTPAAAYVATAGHADHATTQYVDPGEASYPYKLGFVLPAEARDNVVLDLGIDNWTHERAVFAGSIAVR